MAAAGQRRRPGQRAHGGGKLPNQVDRLARWVLLRVTHAHTVPLPACRACCLPPCLASLHLPTPHCPAHGPLPHAHNHTTKPTTTPRTAGVYIESGPERDELTTALHSEGYSPVYLDQKTCDLHYNGFCNSVLWQLFHYVPLNIGAPAVWGWAFLGGGFQRGGGWGGRPWGQPGGVAALPLRAPAYRCGSLRACFCCARGGVRYLPSFPLCARHFMSALAAALPACLALPALPPCRQQAERDAHAAVPVGRAPAGQQDLCRQGRTGRKGGRRREGKGEGGAEGSTVASGSRARGAASIVERQQAQGQQEGAGWLAGHMRQQLSAWCRPLIAPRARPARFPVWPHPCRCGAAALPGRRHCVGAGGWVHISMNPEMGGWAHVLLLLPFFCGP